MDHSFRRKLLITIPGFVSLAPLLVLPVMVGAFVDVLGLSERDAGLLSSAGFLGGALAALFIAFRIHHFDLRKLAIFGLSGMLLADLASTQAAHFSLIVLLGLRFVSGAAGGCVYAAVMSSYASFREPDRAYGLFMAVQFAISGLGLLLLPRWLPELGIEGLFTLFAALDLLAFLVVSYLPGKQERFALAKLRLPEWKVIFTTTALFCLLAYGLFETMQMAQFTYIERIGTTIGLQAGQLGLALGLASFVGIPAAFAVTWLGSRFGYFRPIAVAVVLQIVVMYWLLHARSFPEFLITTSLFSCGWAFVLPYFQAIEAKIDPGGSVVVAGSFATASAGFIGPAGTAFLVRPGDYSLMLWAVMVGLAGVIVLTRLVTWKLADANVDNSAQL